MQATAKRLFIFVLLCCLAACELIEAKTTSNANVSVATVDMARLHTNLGAAYLQKNKLEIALDEFKEAIEIMPTFAMAYNGLAMVRSALGQDMVRH
ncbi:MAG: tetratricopeptide repeat protein [Methylophilaceae bacterium]|jgi:type IV pilus assembly protein PilF|nr:tetratricopeptide repeat protein [Methylophilaceae bacterium]MDG1453793.1 tetratricopeptide repeat protein [Methylophilaceae bacterium]